MRVLATTGLGGDVTHVRKARKATRSECHTFEGFQCID